MSKLGLSLSCLLLACLVNVSSAPSASADVPQCPAVWATSTIPWTGPAAHQDMAVSGTSSSDVWVAGNDGNFEEDPTPILAHTDGSQWALVSLPVGDPGSLVGLATIAPGDVWAAGYLGTFDVADRHALLLHWDGSSVQSVSDPISQSGADASSVTGVAASDSGNVWVVGRETNGGVTTPVAERWDGSAWVEHDPVLPAGSDATVRAVSTTGPDDAWVVGGRRNEQGRATTLAEHWNGSDWRVVRTPDDGGLRATLALTGVTEVSRGDAWAVGLARYQNSPPGRGARVAVLVNHWDGSAWTAMTPQRGIRVKYAFEPAVAALGPGDVWVSVANVQLSPVYRKLPFLHWDGASFQPVTVPESGSNRFAVPVVTTLGAAGPAELLVGAYGWMCPMVVGDGGFSPPAVSAAPLARFKHLRRPQRIYPETLTFHVDRAAGGPHEVKDASGLGLFDSGSLAPGASFTHDLTAAGAYPVVDPSTGATGAVEAPVQISPRKGNVALGFAVGAGQSRRRPDGLHVDMEIREPGNVFVPWPSGNAGGDLFSMDDSMWTVAGVYGFRARLVDPATGAATDWSPEATVKVKCCHAQVLPRGFVLPSSTSVIGEPFVWRVHDTTGQTHVVEDRSPFHLLRSPPLADGQSFSYTFKGAGSYSVLDASTGFHSGIGIRPRTSALFATVGQRVRITAATTAPKRAWRQWRTQILRPGESGFHAWSGAPSADFIPQRPGVFLFRTRLYDAHLRQAINWSPVLTVRAQQGS